MAETSTTALSVYSAKPTIRINTQEYAKLNELLTSMEMTEQNGGMSALELRFNNVASDPTGGAAFAFEDDRVLRLGAAIVVYSGDETAPQEVFRGHITGLEADFPADGAPELVVLAEDALQRSRMARRTKIYENATLADLGRQLANQLGLTPVITGLSDDLGTQVQMDESDLAFLRRLLSRYDGDMQVVGSELHVSPRGDVRRGSLELEMHSQLRRARFLADLSHQVTQVTIAGWDAVQGRRAVAASRGAHSGPGNGQTGSQILSDTLGERSHHISHLAVTTEAEARTLAEAVFDSHARGFVRVEGTAEGNAALRVGTHVQIKGVGDRFENTYYVTRTCHRFDGSRGYETDFDAECGFWGGGQ